MAEWFLERNSVAEFLAMTRIGACQCLLTPSNAVSSGIQHWCSHSGAARVVLQQLESSCLDAPATEVPWAERQICTSGLLAVVACSCEDSAIKASLPEMWL